MNTFPATRLATHVVLPDYAQYWRLGVHSALEVHVVPFLDAQGVQGAAELDTHDRDVCQQECVAGGTRRTL